MTERVSPLLAAMTGAGGVVSDYQGAQVVRHFGDPSAEYAAATERMAVFDRSHRARLVVRGRAPGQMLNGVLTGSMPGGPTAVEAGVLGGTATYHTVLTPKGRMITDLWAMLRGDEGEDGFLLDVPIAGVTALSENFQKVLPPRFARVEDVSEAVSMITVAGPGSAGTLSRLALGLRVEDRDLSGLGEGEWRVAGDSVPEGLCVIKTDEVWPDAYNVMGPTASVTARWRALVDDGASPAGLGVWSTLRVEAGRPVFGSDMDEKTIPIEAGIHDRAIDYQKGCYTGQEVIIRIRDRGHVNRHLRQLHLGDVATPAAGTELFDDGGKSVGRITSAVQSPKFEEVIALAYVRRGVEAVVVEGRPVTVPADAS